MPWYLNDDGEVASDKPLLFGGLDSPEHVRRHSPGGPFKIGERVWRLEVPVRAGDPEALQIFEIVDHCADPKWAMMRPVDSPDQIAAYRCDDFALVIADLLPDEPVR